MANARTHATSQVPRTRTRGAHERGRSALEGEWATAAEGSMVPRELTHSCHTLPVVVSQLALCRVCGGRRKYS